MLLCFGTGLIGGSGKCETTKSGSRDLAGDVDEKNAVIVIVIRCHICLCHQIGLARTLLPLILPLSMWAFCHSNITTFTKKKKHYILGYNEGVCLVYIKSIPFYCD